LKFDFVGILRFDFIGIYIKGGNYLLMFHVRSFNGREIFYIIV